MHAPGRTPSGARSGRGSPLPARRRRRLATALAVVALGSATACSASASPLPLAVASIAVDPASASPTDRAIAASQARLQANLQDDGARLDLATGVLQKARETADPSLYARADALLAVLAQRQPKDGRVLILRAVLALARHQFAKGRTLAVAATVALPGNPAALAALVDALTELGRVEEASAVTQQLLDVRPALPALTRASYARELRGDLTGAALAMQQATVAGAGEAPENVAFAQVQFGHLLLASGDRRGADAAYAAALTTFPASIPAKAGQARSLVAAGRPGDAAEVLAALVDAQPLAEYAIALGDALAGAGRAAEANKAYERVDAIQALAKANGIDVDLELAGFDAERRPGDATVALARKGFATHPSLYGHDVVAWNLFRAGNAKAAKAESLLAIRLGWRDPAVRYHAAEIDLALGDRAGAAEQLRVVASTNPRFSAAHAADVERLGAELGVIIPPPMR